MDNLQLNPFTVIVDTREQSAFDFRIIKADSKGLKPGEPTPVIIVPTKRVALKTGDYSIEGYEDRIAVERKSLEDFFHCVGSDRSRFEQQLTRLNELECPSMMIEADWARIMKGCPNSKLKPKTVLRSVIAWQQDYFPRVHWWFAPGKGAAEVFTFRILNRFWEKRISGK